MAVRYLIVKNKKMKAKNPEHAKHIAAFDSNIKNKSDKLMNYFLAIYFIGGLALANFYDTWTVAIGVGGLSLIAYYSAKFILPDSNFYQYVLSGVMGIFMAQYIFQMHGLFEMHFMAFIGSVMLITYQNWKLQLPLVAVVVIHHATFGYLQYIGTPNIHFTQLEYMNLQTFIIHVTLAAVIFSICGLWAYHFQKFSEEHLEQTYKMATLQESETQKEALQKANNQLDKFVYSVSHDLRAPLASMTGIIDITLNKTKEELVIKHLDMLKKNIKKLDGFVLDILDYSRNSRTEIKKEEIDFKEILNEITNNLKYMSHVREVEIKLSINQKSKFVTDPTRLSIILNNLISNAIRYQNIETNVPFVHVEIISSEEDAYIKIADNGIGISKENHEKIFDMFYRVTNNSVGSGLGLYIVKETIDKLEGQIDVESELNKGTTFNIHIPNNN